MDIKEIIKESAIFIILSIICTVGIWILLYLVAGPAIIFLLTTIPGPFTDWDLFKMFMEGGGWNWLTTQAIPEWYYPLILDHTYFLASILIILAYTFFMYLAIALYSIVHWYRSKNIEVD